MAPSRTATCFISTARHLATKIVQLIHFNLHILMFYPSVLATVSVLQTLDSYSYFDLMQLSVLVTVPCLCNNYIHMLWLVACGQLPNNLIHYMSIK